MHVCMYAWYLVDEDDPINGVRKVYHCTTGIMYLHHVTGPLWAYLPEATTSNVTFSFCLGAVKVA